MQKVLHVVEALEGGVFTFFTELINRQCDNFEIFVAYGLRPFTHKNFRDFFDKRIHFIRIHHFQRTIGIRDIGAFFELRRILQEVQPDIVHLHSSKAGFIGRWAFDCSKYKVFYTPHGFPFLIDTKGKWKRNLYRLIEYVSAQRRVVTIACGKGEYEEAVKLSPYCTYVNNGVNVRELASFFSMKPYVDCISPAICTIGRISYQKNPLLFNEIAIFLPHARFIWVGDGEMRTGLTAPNIEVTGWLERKEVLRILAGADFFLLASLWEGLPLSLLEAMYLKKVCLVSDVSGNREVIEDGRNGFVCHTAEEYALRINGILYDGKEQQRLTEQAHDDVLKWYNTDMMAASYKNIYNGQLTVE
jgi:glycosyltransferase involved in cell wall biosynthesis